MLWRRRYVADYAPLAEAAAPVAAAAAAAAAAVAALVAARAVAAALLKVCLLLLATELGPAIRQSNIGMQPRVQSSSSSCQRFWDHFVR